METSLFSWNNTLQTLNKRIKTHNKAGVKQAAPEWFYPATCFACPKPGPGFSTLFVFFFVFNDLR